MSNTANDIKSTFHSLCLSILAECNTCPAFPAAHSSPLSFRFDEVLYRSSQDLQPTHIVSYLLTLRYFINLLFSGIKCLRPDMTKDLSFV